MTPAIAHGVRGNLNPAGTGHSIADPMGIDIERYSFMRLRFQSHKFKKYILQEKYHGKSGIFVTGIDVPFENTMTVNKLLT